MPASGRGRKRPRGGGTAALPPLPHDRQKRFRGAGAASSATLFPRPQRPFPRHGPSGNTLPQTARCTCPPLFAPRPLFRAHMAPSRALLSRSPLERPFPQKKGRAPARFPPRNAPSGSASALFRAPLSGRPPPARREPEAPPRPEASGCSFRRPAQKKCKKSVKKLPFFSFSGRKRRFSAVSGAPSAFHGRHLRKNSAFSGPPFPSGRKSVSFFLPP